MNKIYFLLSICINLSACKGSTAADNNNNSQQQDHLATDSIKPNNSDQEINSIDLRKLFTVSEAEKILGEPAHLSDSSTSIKDDYFVYSSAFTASKQAPEKDKTGTIYFLIEYYAIDSSAHGVYTSIKTANENHGIKTLHDLGDEAYFHSDNQNFYFLMVRKGTKMFRMKVNKITKSTSLDAFYEVAKNITAII